MVHNYNVYVVGLRSMHVNTEFILHTRSGLRLISANNYGSVYYAIQKVVEWVLLFSFLFLQVVWLMLLYSSIQAFDMPNALIVGHCSTVCLSSSKPSLSLGMSTDSMHQWNRTSLSLRTCMINYSFHVIQLQSKRWFTSLSLRATSTATKICVCNGYTHVEQFLQWYWKAHSY